MRIGWGAFPSIDNLLNVSLQTGEYILICLHRESPSGRSVMRVVESVDDDNELIVSI